MGETRELIGIYGAIDRAVADDEVLRQEVAKLLPVYAESNPRWFDQFEAWTLRRLGGEPREPPFPRSIGEALGGLSEFREPPPRMRARRVWATAVAVRAFPERMHPDSDGDLVPVTLSVLQAEGLARDDRNARELLELLSDDAGLVPGTPPPLLDEWWNDVVRRAVSQNNITDTLEDIGPRPCIGRLVDVTMPGGGTLRVASLKAGFETDKLSFARACRFLDPTLWPGCNDFWCQMKKVADTPAGARRYHEVVSSDCRNAASAWTISAELDFRFRRTERFARAAYRLADGVAQPDVVVDEGSLVVEAIPNTAPQRLRVTTTKRVMFTESFSGEALALIMCALGYASVAEDLVFSCALEPDEKGKPFPKDAPVKTDDSAGAEPGTGSLMDDLIDEAAAAVKACVEESAEAAKATLDKVEKGEYTADQAVQDVVDASLRMLRDGAKGVDLGIRAAARVRQAPGG